MDVHVRTLTNVLEVWLLFSICTQLCDIQDTETRGEATVAAAETIVEEENDHATAAACAEKLSLMG